MTFHENDIIANYFSPKEGDLVIDVGAHIGPYTLVASKLVGENGKVVAAIRKNAVRMEEGPAHDDHGMGVVRAGETGRAFQLVGLDESDSRHPILLIENQLRIVRSPEQVGVERGTCHAKW